MRDFDAAKQQSDQWWLGQRRTAQDDRMRSAAMIAREADTRLAAASAPSWSTPEQPEVPA